MGCSLNAPSLKVSELASRLKDDKKTKIVNRNNNTALPVSVVTWIPELFSHSVAVIVLALGPASAMSAFM